MKKVLYTAVLISLFTGATAFTSVAASQNETHHPADEQTGATSTKGMMMQQGADMDQRPCMAASASGSKSQMMGMMGGKEMGGKEMGGMMGGMMRGEQKGMMGEGGMQGMMHGGRMMHGNQMGMMEHGKGHMFYLDRAEELGLSAEQVSKLKAIHAEGRKDKIRNAAEAKIARLELSDLLSGDTWTLKDAESLVRKAQTLEGDIQIRRLQAMSDARKVLTAEQLQQAHADGSSGSLESLFQ